MTSDKPLSVPFGVRASTFALRTEDLLGVLAVAHEPARFGGAAGVGADEHHKGTPENLGVRSARDGMCGGGGDLLVTRLPVYS